MGRGFGEGDGDGDGNGEGIELDVAGWMKDRIRMYVGVGKKGNDV